jgi:hypothetical protein
MSSNAGRDITPNKWGDLVSVVEGLDSNDLILPVMEKYEKINEKESGMYMIAILDRIHNQSMAKYENRVRIQFFSKTAWNKSIRKNLERIGADKKVIVHNPEVAKASPKKKKEDQQLKAEAGAGMPQGSPNEDYNELKKKALKIAEERGENLAGNLSADKYKAYLKGIEEAGE